MLLESIPPQRRNDMAFGILCAFDQVAMLWLDYPSSGLAELDAAMEALGEDLLRMARVAREIYDASVCAMREAYEGG